MIKDLTTLKWKKNIYYISDGTIFDIEPRSKTFDIDCCGEYLIDNSKLNDKDKTAKEGTSLNISYCPEAFIKSVPHIYLEFESEGGEILKRYFPLQYLIVEGDKFIDGKVSQLHPNVFDNKYVNKFNQEVFDYIKTVGKDNLSSRNIKLVSDSLPSWLFNSSEFMAEEYIDRYFLKGNHYNKAIASKLVKENTITYQLKATKLGIGEELYVINIWDNILIFKALQALHAQKIVNTYNQTIKDSNSKSLVKDSMEAVVNAIKDVSFGNNENLLNTFLNINYEDGIKVYFESLCVPSNIDTVYEYNKHLEEEKARIRSYFTLVKDEESWNASNQEGGGLYKYYIWSDQANAPYKEDLWNTSANRAANINDARKDPDSGELVLDEKGNYIYDNCERCWQGAVKAPGAKYPWIVLNVTDETPSLVTFKYTYPDGTVKEVNPWGNKVFGGPTESRREWGCASVASEFGDNDFIISENRTDGGESTFDVERFELILTPVAE